MCEIWGGQSGYSLLDSGAGGSQKVARVIRTSAPHGYVDQKPPSMGIMAPFSISH